MPSLPALKLGAAALLALGAADVVWINLALGPRVLDDRTEVATVASAQHDRAKVDTAKVDIAKDDRATHDLETPNSTKHDASKDDVAKVDVAKPDASKSD